MNLNKLALVCSAVCAVLPEKEVEVSGIHCDSRQIQPGDLFVALGGTQTNGKHYIGEALRRGAVAVLTSFPLPLSVPQLIVESNEKARTAFGKLAHSLAQDPSQELKSYGVTGTNGKTTITYMLSSIFGQERCGILGTTGNRFQDEEEESTWTTPSPVELVRFLSKAKEKGMTHCCFEASSHALAQERLSGMRIRGGIFTNLTPEHLDYHPSMQHYALSKKKLLQQVDLGGVVAINGDSPYSAFMSADLEHVRVLSYGLSPNAEVSAQGVFHRSERPVQLFRLNVTEDSALVELPLLGIHNVYNALAAATIAYAESVPLERIVQALSELPRIPGRLELVAERPKVFIDYAHTPDALKHVLASLKAWTRGRLFCIFGCGGNRDRGKRPAMGRIAKEWADEICLTSDNPRHEDPLEILEEILQGIEDKASVSVEPDRRRAIQGVLQKAKAEDVILIAGKGHERYQIIGEERIPFSDHDVVQEMLH